MLSKIRFRYWDFRGECSTRQMTFDEFEGMVRKGNHWGGPLPESEEQPDEHNLGYQYRCERGECSWQVYRGRGLGWSPIEGGRQKVLEDYAKMLSTN